MRVSKVSVDVPKEGKKMVLMSRDQKQGNPILKGTTTVQLLNIYTCYAPF